MPPTYPEPLIIPPLRSHKQTFILLHGRGSSAAQFGPPLLKTPIPVSRSSTSISTSSSTEAEESERPTTTLRDAFPHARFVFLTAAPRRAAVFNRSVINQWFDIWSPNLTSTSRTGSYHEQEGERREELQVAGLRESSAFVHGVIRREAGVLGEGEGKPRIVLGGLSQGCAMAMISLLLWEEDEDGSELAGVVGMSGWLPLRRRLEEFSSSSRGKGALLDGEEFNPFDEGMDDDEDVAAYLRDQLDILPSRSISTSPPAFQRTPIFLAHGTEDEKVPVARGEEAVRCLRALGAENVVWRAYDGLGHWYSSAMLRDMVRFLKDECDV